MRHEITGTNMPVLEMYLDPGDTIVAESGELSWMTPGIKLETSMGAGGSGGGLFGAVKRKIAGGSFWMTQFTAEQAGEVAFAARVPGHFVAIDVTDDNHVRIHRHGFVCGTEGIALELAFQQKFSAGIFGGEGFRLQKVVGKGLAFIQLSGEMVLRELKEGQVLLAHPGHVGIFEGSVKFEITTVPGIKNKFFGGDGLFLAKLTGPGKVWLQTMPLPNLAHALTPFIKTELAEDDDDD